MVLPLFCLIDIELIDRTTMMLEMFNARGDLQSNEFLSRGLP